MRLNLLSFLVIFSFNCLAQDLPFISEKDFVPEKILGFILKGDFDNDHLVQKWNAPRFINYTTNDSYAFSACDTIIDFQQDTTKYKLVVIKTLMVGNDSYSFQDCNACPPMIGLALFENQDQKWILNSFKLDVTRFGHFSEIPESSIIRIGVNQWGVKFKDEVIHDIGLEKWYQINETFDPYLTFEYFSISQRQFLCSEKMLEKNSKGTDEFFLIERDIVPLESEKEFFDLQVNSRCSSPDESGELNSKPIFIEQCLFSMDPYESDFKNFNR